MFYSQKYCVMHRFAGLRTDVGKVQLQKWNHLHIVIRATMQIATATETTSYRPG